MKHCKQYIVNTLHKRPGITVTTFRSEGVDYSADNRRGNVPGGVRRRLAREAEIVRQSQSTLKSDGSSAMKALFSGIRMGAKE